MEKTGKTNPIELTKKVILLTSKCDNITVDKYKTVTTINGSVKVVDYIVREIEIYYSENKSTPDVLELHLLGAKFNYELNANDSLEIKKIINAFIDLYSNKVLDWIDKKLEEQ